MFVSKAVGTSSTEVSEEVLLAKVVGRFSYLQRLELLRRYYISPYLAGEELNSFCERLDLNIGSVMNYFVKKRKQYQQEDEEEPMECKKFFDKNTNNSNSEFCYL